MSDKPSSVSQYYDRNTLRFLARGEGGSEGVIHRAVWAEGVRTRAEAMHYVHSLLLEELESTEALRPRILDLGCGVGASLLYLLSMREGEGYGVTISAVQAALARERASGRASFLEGDFETTSLPDGIDLGFGIESFVHARDAGAFFRNAAGSLRPGGRLALCDDFLTAGHGEETWVREFRLGWHASSLLVPAEADALAEPHGLELLADRDLTRFLDVDRPRDRAIRVAVALGRPVGLSSPGFLALLGGNALRQCLKRGFVTYRFRVWRKREVS